MAAWCGRNKWVFFVCLCVMYEWRIVTQVLLNRYLSAVHVFAAINAKRCWYCYYYYCYYALTRSISVRRPSCFSATHRSRRIKRTLIRRTSIRLNRQTRRALRASRRPRTSSVSRQLVRWTPQSTGESIGGRIQPVVRGNAWFCEHLCAWHLWCIRRSKKALERERERNEHKSYTWIWLKNIISDSAIINPNAAPAPFRAIVFRNKINAVVTRYAMFKNTEQEMPAMAPSSIAFADLLLTMILSKTAPWETAMMEKMDAIKALNAQTYHKPLRPTQVQHPPILFSSFFARSVEKVKVFN